jgi:hypothetical protein
MVTDVPEISRRSVTSSLASTAALDKGRAASISSETAAQERTEHSIYSRTRLTSRGSSSGSPWAAITARMATSDSARSRYGRQRSRRSQLAVLHSDSSRNDILSDPTARSRGSTGRRIGACLATQAAATVRGKIRASTFASVTTACPPCASGTTARWLRVSRIDVSTVCSGVVGART